MFRRLSTTNAAALATGLVLTGCGANPSATSSPGSDPRRRPATARTPPRALNREPGGRRKLVPSQATFALVMVEARLMTFRSLGAVVCLFRQAM